MIKPYINESLLTRFDELLTEGERLWTEFKKNKNGIIFDTVGFSQWATSCLNLLDKLSISTNRFVSQFEIWVKGGLGQKFNIGGALGVLKSARDEYVRGFAIEYQLAVSATVFSGLLEEASYLFSKDYYRAAVVLLGAALEEGLKARAKSISIEIGPRDALSVVINKLKAPEINVLTEFQAKNLEAIARLRNDAAHGGEFNYPKEEINSAFKTVEDTLNRLLGGS